MASAIAKIEDTKFELPYPSQGQPSIPRRRPYGSWIALALLVCTGYMMTHCPQPPNTLSEAQHQFHPINVPERIQRSWAMYSPWRPEGIYPPPPVGCEVTQVNLLQRHGARHPSGDDGTAYHKAVKKLLKVKGKVSKHSKLAFIKDYKYVLHHNDLVAFGAEQSRKLGSIDFNRYPSLVSPKMLPFVRASDADRVVNSAWNWTAGFAHASPAKLPVNVSLVISESRNNTLDIDMCPNAGEGEAQMLTWLSVFAPRIIARLEAAAPGTKLSLWDIYHLMAICPIETLYLQRASPFCALFDEDEWDAFEYTGDLEKFYKTGYGEPLGPVQGVGYVNELLARLTNTPVRDRTQVNHTLDDSPATFPLNRTFYADFTHENLIVAVFAAMGLYRDENPLDPLAPDAARAWVASRLVPFSARMVTERLACSGTGEQLEGEYVRMLVNDQLVELECADGRLDGMCELAEFVDGQAYARSGGAGDFEKCGYEVEEDA